MALRAHYMLRWTATTGEKGPWSETANTERSCPMAEQRSGWMKPIVIGIVSGLITSGVVGIAAYYRTTESVASMIAEGVAILDAQSTSDALGQIAASCREVSAVLAERKPRPAQQLIPDLRDAFKGLSQSIDKVKTTEYYSVDEIMKLTTAAFSYSDRKAIVDSHVGKPKRTVSGLTRLKPQLAKIGELLESLDRQLAQEPSIDLDSLRKVSSEIERLASAAQASLDSRQAATLQTLDKLDRRSKKRKQ